MKLTIIQSILGYLPYVVFLILLNGGGFIIAPKIATWDPVSMTGLWLMISAFVFLHLWYCFMPASDIVLLPVDPIFFAEHFTELGNISEVVNIAGIHLQETHISGQGVTNVELYLAFKKALLTVCDLSDGEADKFARQLANIVVCIYNKKI